MNDFYSAAAQIIPVLLLAILVDLAPGPTILPVQRIVLRLAAVLGLAGEMAALAGLSFDEEQQPRLNDAVTVFVWFVIAVLLCTAAWRVFEHTSKAHVA